MLMYGNTISLMDATYIIGQHDNMICPYFYQCTYQLWVLCGCRVHYTIWISHTSIEQSNLLEPKLETQVLHDRLLRGWTSSSRDMLSGCYCVPVWFPSRASLGVMDQRQQAWLECNRLWMPPGSTQSMCMGTITHSRWKVATPSTSCWCPEIIKSVEEQ